MNGKPPILEDVAKLAGVSKSTASRILGAPIGKPIPFAHETQARVREAADRLGYSPSRLARGLSRDRTGIVGLVIPSVKDSFFPIVTAEIEASLAEKGFNVILTHTAGRPEIERARIMDLLSWRVDGLVIAPCQGPGGSEIFWELWNRKIPFVLVDRAFPQTPFPAVVTDDRSGGSLATAQLLAPGRTRIAFASGSQGISTNRMRRAGYEDALLDRGIRRDPSLVIEVPSTFEGGHEAAAAALALNPRADGLFCASDLIAAGALEELLDRSVSVPGDVGLAGYADLEYSRLLRVPLTTVRQPTGLIGRTAADMILARIERRPDLAAEVRLSVDLVIRASAP